jgi:protein involved in polysaccharide export with SLBB domain
MQSQPEPVAFPHELNKEALPAYVVEPGDVLLVQSVDLNSPVGLPGDQPVLLDGTINLGKYGELKVAGKTVAAIEADVQALIKSTTPNAGQLTVRLINRVSKVYYVLGEVNAPGSFPLSGRETVLDGIIAAGGLNDRASRRNIVLSRPTAPADCRIVLPICYREIVQVGDTSTNYQLAPGDRIFVATRGFFEGFPCCRDKDCPPCGGAQIPCHLPTESTHGHLPQTQELPLPKGSDSK